MKNLEKDSSKIIYWIIFFFFYPFQMVANYYGVSKHLVDIPGRRIHWAGDRDGPPPDTPPCGFDNSKCPDNSKSNVSFFLQFINLSYDELRWHQFTRQACLSFLYLFINGIFLSVSEICPQICALLRRLTRLQVIASFRKHLVRETSDQKIEKKNNGPLH